MPEPGRSLPQGLKSKKMSVMVLHRTKDTMELVAAVRAYRERLAAAIGERYAPRLQRGESLPDYVLMLELAARDLTAALKRLIELDDRVDYGEVGRDLRRLERNALAVEVLYPCAVSVRGEMDLAFGREAGRGFHGMRGKTRRRAPLLLAQLRQLVQCLEAPDCALPERRNPHVRVDRARWSHLLVPRYRELVKLDAEVTRLRDHVVPALILEKNAAMETFDSAYGDALRLVATIFRLARFDLGLIKNLKPYYQRRRLSALARKKREARAAASAGAKAAPEKARPPASKPSRVAISKTVQRWLEQHRLFGT